MTHGALDALASLLFVPGARPERFARALESGAGLVCIDLEDSVPADGKAAARAAAIAAIGPRLAVRVNVLASRDGLIDLVALADAAVRPAAVLIPKVEHAAEVAIAAGALAPGQPIVPLIETPLGLDHAAAIAAHPQVAAMMFGGGDMAAELGVDIAWEPLLAARGAFLLACARAGKPAIDVPWVALDDADGLAAEAARARGLGFSAKAAIHPAQVPAIEAAFRPSTDEVAEARAALAAFAAAGGAAVRFNSRMLEAPVMRRYQRNLARVEGNTHA